MQISKAATRYAKSLLDLAVEQGSLEDVYTDVQLVLETLHQTHELDVLVESQVIQEDKKFGVYQAVFGGKVQELTMKFMELITKGGRSQLLDNIFEAFVDQYKMHKRILTIEVTSAKALTQEVKDSIIAKIKNENWKTYELVEKVDPKVIGGFVLRTNNLQVDRSIATQLRTLKNNFDNEHFVVQY